jgi:hypothetical protein
MGYGECERGDYWPGRGEWVGESADFSGRRVRGHGGVISGQVMVRVLTGRIFLSIAERDWNGGGGVCT